MAAGFKTATVNASDVPATQTDFPAYVDLSRLGITTLAEAQSVRVYADSGKTTEWAREIVSAAEMHVKVPSLTSTTSIYVDWDGVSADYAVTDTYGRNAVWSDYRAVYHLEDTSDSTSNAYTLTNTGTVTFASGQLGNGADYGNTNTTKKLSIANNLGLNGDSNITISGWVKRAAEITAGNPEEMIFAHRSSSVNTRYFQSSYEYNSGTPRFNANVANSFIRTNQSVSTSWFHYVDTRAQTTIAYARYYNGSALGTGTGSTATAAQNLFGIGTEGGTYGLWDGMFDEVRVRNWVASANWITTEYNNQSDEAGFWGTWSDVGGATDTTKFFALM